METVGLTSSGLPAKWLASALLKSSLTHSRGSRRKGVFSFSRDSCKGKGRSGSSHPPTLIQVTHTQHFSSEGSDLEQMGHEGSILLPKLTALCMLFLLVYLFTYFWNNLA